ncbi:DUF2304 domain-containing protein [Radiobacillus deserti]|uniref:DUF2304 domain-containing protein n=1 Tax=Radiobacillus deserti TaxID=2594883 RepID=A0A516KLG6_9BACI|nr:DUF2304 domain-containing protein [Radiobacillus deserti]
MPIVQIITIIIAVLFFIQVLYFSSKNKLQDQQAFLWVVFATLGLIVSIFLPFFNRLAAEIGISYMPSLVFTIAFLVILNLLIYQTIHASKQESKIKQLTQELSFLSKQVEELQKSVEKDR